MEFDINYFAVVAAAIGNMVVGTLWYGPVFGKKWKAYMGFTDEKMKSMPLTAWQAMVGGAAIALIMSYVLSHVGNAFGAAGLSGALQLGFWMWLGFAIPLSAGSFLWEGKPIGLFVLNSTQWLVSLCVMASVLVLWPWS